MIYPSLITDILLCFHLYFKSFELRKNIDAAIAWYYFTQCVWLIDGRSFHYRFKVNFIRCISIKALTNLVPTTIPRRNYWFSFDHQSQATSGTVSTWMGDRLGTPCVVGFFFFIFSCILSIYIYFYHFLCCLIYCKFFFIPWILQISL